LAFAASTVINWVRRFSGDGQRSARPDGRPQAQGPLLANIAPFSRAGSGKGRSPYAGWLPKLAERRPQGRLQIVWNLSTPRNSASKKTVVASERNRPDVAQRRTRWIERQGRIAPERLVFIDETWTKTNMAPLRGWAPRGERLVAEVPHGHWKTMTSWPLFGMIASKRLGFLTVRSTARASKPMSIRAGAHASARRYRRNGPISAATKERPFGGRSERPRQNVLLPKYSPISIPSNRSSLS